MLFHAWRRHCDSNGHLLVPRGGEGVSGPRPLIYQGIFDRVMGSVYQARAPDARASRSETERTGVPSQSPLIAIGVRGQPEPSLDPKLITGRRLGLPPLPHVELQAPEPLPSLRVARRPDLSSLPT
jgi:hypothetical protein